MNILIVGNILHDVYLNLDSRTENFETDENGVKWLDFSFDASIHKFFSHHNSFGGAAVSLEVFSKMGLNAEISNANLSLSEDGFVSNDLDLPSRYILINDGKVAYLAPASEQKTTFTPPETKIDYLFIDRSAFITSETAEKIHSYLKSNPSVGLILYVKDFNNQNLNKLIPDSILLFLEHKKGEAKTLNLPELEDFDPRKIIYISENRLTYLGISETISDSRVDMKTHLSTYNIAAATILSCFILGKTIEESFEITRVNIEKSRLDSSLPLSELEKLASDPSPSESLELIAKTLVLKNKGILAADESGGSIEKKFAKLNIPDTYENRRDYRNIFFTTRDIEKYINGIILFDETARQFADNGQDFVDYIISKRIIPGIKVDQGLEKFPDSEETYTKGLETLPARLAEYYEMGLRFAKWRAAFEIRLDEGGNLLTPTDFAIKKNCEILAKYAKDCQSAGLVPIVEPEVVYDGAYTIDINASVTGKILDELFVKLKEENINLRACILKVNMVLAGKKLETDSTPEEVGEKTAAVLKAHVPEDLAGVVFLSGGQTVDQATDNLAMIEKNGPFPWPVTFSFARALQDPALYAWNGDNANIEKARQAFLDRLIKNAEALKAE